MAVFLVENGRGLLPMLDPIGQRHAACNGPIGASARAASQAMTQLSAMEAAEGPSQQGWQRSGK